MNEAVKWYAGDNQTANNHMHLQKHRHIGHKRGSWLSQKHATNPGRDCGKNAIMGNIVLISASTGLPHNHQYNHQIHENGAGPDPATGAGAPKQDQEACKYAGSEDFTCETGHHRMNRRRKISIRQGSLGNRQANNMAKKGQNNRIMENIRPCHQGFFGEQIGRSSIPCPWSAHITGNKAQGKYCQTNIWIKADHGCAQKRKKRVPET